MLPSSRRCLLYSCFFVDRNGFWYHILTQIVRIVFIVASLLPVWGIKRLMKVEDIPMSSQKWSLKKRIVFAAAAVVYGLAMLFAVGISSDKIYTLIVGNDVPAVIYSPLYIVLFAVAVELFILSLFFFTRNGVILLGSARSLPMKKRIAGFAAGTAVCVLIASICFFNYSVVTPDGVERVVFGRKTSYTWEDAVQVRLSARHDGTLGIEAEFSDGTKQTILGPSCGETDMLSQRYPDGVAQMVGECVATLHRAGVPFAEQEDIGEKLDCDYWVEYLEALRTVYRAAK